jgi:septal ring factor EnvC (AmiA/AmiB activator)
MDSNDNHTTNDDLAVMIGKGFEHVEQRFAAVDKRFDGVDERLDKLEKGQQTLFETVRDFSPKVQQKLEASVQDQEKRLKKLETRPA